MVRRGLCAMALLLAGCEIDSSKLDDIRCTTGDDCGAPDLDCVSGYCVAAGCSTFSDCGPGFQFVCEEGGCRAVTCDGAESCAAGFDCVEGYCAGDTCGSDDDVDGDGYLSIGCGGQDCDDLDFEVKPDATEGGGDRDDPTCTDGKDNDCDGDVDADEPNCGPCQEDGDCNDGNPCTSERCFEGDCLASPLDGDACDDGDPCTANDVCEVILCTGEPYSCEDGLDCTDDACDGGGGCSNEPVDGQCLIDGECVAGGAVSSTDPCDECDPARAQDDWSARQGACDDGDDCTTDDACDAGVCAGDPYDCDDGLACTADTCDGAGGCGTAIVAGSCLVDGVCYADGDRNPLNACELCDPVADELALSPDDAFVPDDGLSCTQDSCAGGLEQHLAQDGLCGLGQVCAPCAGTVNGCAPLPPSLTLACDASADQGVPGAACAIDLGATAGQAACLSCTSQLGITPLVREDFGGCPDLAAAGWTVAGTPTCPADLGVGPDPLVAQDALEAEGTTWTLTRTFDTTGLDRVRLCFDYADDNAGNNDSLRIQMDTDGTFDTIFEDFGGPVANVDDGFTRFCIDLEALDPDAADNPALRLAIRATAQGLDNNVYLDNVVLEGWATAFVTLGSSVLIDGFTGCDLTDWTATGDAVGCPIVGGAFNGREALFASSTSWSLARALDAASICDDLTVSFDYTTSAPAAADVARLTFDPGTGPLLAWSAFGAPEAEGIFRRFDVNLSHLDPSVRFSADVPITLALDADAGGSLYLDNVSASGATCASGDDDLVVGAAADAGGGDYDVAVVSPLRTRAYLSCAWDGRATVSDRATIDFLP